MHTQEHAYQRAPVMRWNHGSRTTMKPSYNLLFRPAMEHQSVYNYLLSFALKELKEFKKTKYMLPRQFIKTTKA